MLEGRNLLVIVISVVLGVGILIPAVCAFVIVHISTRNEG